MQVIETIEQEKGYYFMSKRHGYLSVDFGNSQTRIKVTVVSDNGELHTRQKSLPNRYGYLDERKLYLLEGTEYTENNTKCFTYNGETICVGKMCDTECGNSSVKPTSTDKKFESKYTQYAIRLALMEGYIEIAKMLNEDIEALDIIWHIAVCLPAYDMRNGAKKMQKLISEVDSINFLIPEVKKTITIDPKIAVRPEGYLAYVGVVFENRSLYRYKMSEVAKKKVLVVDMGDGTTDLCLLDGTNLSQQSLHSVPVGGNQVVQTFKREMEQRYGHSFSNDAMQEACVTGILKLGNKLIDVAKDVDEIRKSVAVSVANSIKGYFETLPTSIDEINYILLCGGGALPSENAEKMKSYEYYMRHELSNMMKYADFLDMPKSKEIQNGEERIVQLNPRFLNVIGASILNDPVVNK